MKQVPIIMRKNVNEQLSSSLALFVGSFPSYIRNARLAHFQFS